MTHITVYFLRLFGGLQFCGHVQFVNGHPGFHRVYSMLCCGADLLQDQMYVTKWWGWLCCWCYGVVTATFPHTLTCDTAGSRSVWWDCVGAEWLNGHSEWKWLMKRALRYSKPQRNRQTRDAYNYNRLDAISQVGLGSIQNSAKESKHNMKMLKKLSWLSISSTVQQI